MELSAGQKNALKVMLSGKNVFLSGEAGTGKSVLIREFLSRVKDKNVIITASTGVAAVHIGGVTIHRAFGLGVGIYGPNEEPKEKVSDTLRSADIVLIDEISMVRFDLFTYITKCIRKAEEYNDGKPIQVIVVGDFFQLPPVLTDNDRAALEDLWDMEIVDCFAFLSPLWESYHFETCLLTEIMRQKDDLDFISRVNDIRQGRNTDATIKWFNEHLSHRKRAKVPTLCSTNKDAEKINKKSSMRLKTRSYTFYEKTTGQIRESDRVSEKVLELTVGMRVMAIVNDNIAQLYQNGTVGTITEIFTSPSSMVEVLFDNGNIASITYHKWTITDYKIIKEKGEKKLETVEVGSIEQFPLKVAYAVSIHKSQGKTYDRYNLQPSCFAAGQLYVALSRATGCASISLLSDITPSDLIVSPVVKKFYDSLNKIPEPEEAAPVPEPEETQPDDIKAPVPVTRNEIVVSISVMKDALDMVSRMLDQLQNMLSKSDS